MKVANGGGKATAPTQYCTLRIHRKSSSKTGVDPPPIRRDEKLFIRRRNVSSRGAGRIIWVTGGDLELLVNVASVVHQFAAREVLAVFQDLF